MSMSIRPMRKSDVSAVYEVECACFRSPWSKNSLAGELRNPVAHYHVLDIDGTVAGFAGMWVLFEEAHITNIGVLPEQRRNGYAFALMLSMMEHAQGLGATGMTLEVRETNFGAQKLYQRLGFAQNGYRPRYYEDTGEGAQLLWNTDIAATLAKFGIVRPELPES